MATNELIEPKTIKELAQERRELKKQFNQNKKEKLQNFKQTKKVRIQEIKKENKGKVPKEAQEEFKLMEQEINQEIKLMKQEMEDKLAEIKEEITHIKQKNQKVTKNNPDLAQRQKIREGEQIIQNYMGTSLFKNRDFNSRIINLGVPTLKVKIVWKKVNEQLKQELKEGSLEPEDIPTRLDQLVIEFGTPDIDKTKKIEHINPTQSFTENIETDYYFECGLYEQRINNYGEQEVEYYSGHCFVKEDHLIIKKRSFYRKKGETDKVIHYSNIDTIEYDEETGIHTTSNIIISINGFGTLTLKDITTENFQLLTDVWSNYNNKPHTNPTPETIAETDDFNEFTEELNMNKNINFCPNCGNPVEPNSNFCSYCGFNLLK